MPSLTQEEIRSRALKFSQDWKNESREIAESQTFWNEFFNIFGITRRRIASFEEPVKKLGNISGRIDLFWKGVLLVEHKSKGENLEKAYEQALDYFHGIPENELPQYILVSNFSEFKLFDLESKQIFCFNLTDLPHKIYLFSFISGYKQRIYRDEDLVNIEVAEKLGELHDELLASGYDGHKLEVFLVRLVYCLFADDTGIFPKDHFQYFIETRTKPNGIDVGSIIETIFRNLDADVKDRQNIDEELLQFPYVNGALFQEYFQIPSFTEKMRTLLLECCAFDWSKVSPAIFGSLFQAVMDKSKRRNLGAHYTSEKTILKVIHSLFLDELLQDLKKCSVSIKRLKQFHERLICLRFFDPACGCGNFLIIAYRELRNLEIEIFKQIFKLSKKDIQYQSDVNIISQIDVDAMYGIEIEEFPCRIAEVALWLTDHQMNMKLSEEFGQSFVRLPLQKSAQIKHGNALQIDWEQIFPKPKNDHEPTHYILGNPPFVGKSMRSQEQNRDMESICKLEIESAGILDYVCCWYIQAARYIQDTHTQVAFVSTNSISQGEQVGVLWQYLFSKNIRINFAHRTFRWSNEARGKAAVFCVIIGFANFDKTNKFLYDYDNPNSEPMEHSVKQINPYLIESDNLIITSRCKPICDVPEINFGNMPNDDGNFLLEEKEKNEILDKYPEVKKYVRPLISAQEFLHGKKRYCLWLKDAKPEEILDSPEIKKRVEAVQKYRQSSSRKATQKLSNYPYLFGEIRQPNTDFVLIPCHSSENRKYIPLAFFDKNFVANNSCVFLPNATLYHFGVLQSLIHNVWMRQVCGRIKSDYRYSNNIVYNNFPWPENPTTKQKNKVQQAAQKVLDTRKSFPDSTLADLYDPRAMPKDLVNAHRELDLSVDVCYRREPFTTELESLKYLFDLYRKYTEPLNKQAEKKGGKRR